MPTPAHERQITRPEVLSEEEVWKIEWLHIVKVPSAQLMYYGHDCVYNYIRLAGQVLHWRTDLSLRPRECAPNQRLLLQCGTEGRSDGLRLPPAGGREGGTYPVRGETDRVVSSRGRAASRERSGGSRRVKANQKAARPRTTTVQYSTTCSTTLFNIHTHSDQTGQVRQSACRPSVRPSGLVLARVAVSSGRIFN